MPTFLKYGDKIRGDAKEPAHRGWIELQSIQWGAGRGVSSPTGGIGSRERSSPNISEITVMKLVDSASPHLFREAISGEAVIAVIEFARDDGSVSLRIEMTGTLISGINTSRSGDRPTESLTLNFTKVEVKQIPGTPYGFDDAP